MRNYRYIHKQVFPLLVFIHVHVHDSIFLHYVNQNENNNFHVIYKSQIIRKGLKKMEKKKDTGIKIK